MEIQQYCAFISYRHESPDDRIAKTLHTAIETYGVPAVIRKKTGLKRLGRVFRDQEELPLSAKLGQDIENALDNSQWFIAICSPRYLQSQWCMRELAYFLERKGRDRVLAVLVEGEPENSFPEILRFETDAAGNRREVEPRAADLRGSDWRKKLKDEKLRLLAPMLSVTFDELKRRERQRTLRRTAAISAAVLVAAAGLCAYIAVNQARAQRLQQQAAEQARIAEAERVRAEEEKQRAEEEQKKAEEQKKRAEEEKQRAEEEKKRAEEEKKRAEEEQKKAEEQKQRAEEEQKKAEEQKKRAEEEKKRAEEEQKKAEEQRKKAEEEKKRAEEEKKRAEEEKKRAEEEQKKREQARRDAVFNDLGERLERASTALKAGEKRTAASVLLEALAVSDENEGMRREELIGQLKKALYIEPFTVVSSFNNQNKRVNDIAVSPDGTRAIGIVNSNSVAMIDLNANEIVYQVSGGNTMIVDLRFSADGTRFLAIGDSARSVTVWNAADGSVAFVYTAKADTSYQIANAFFWKDAHEVMIQDHDRFYIVSDDGSERLFYTMGDQMPEYARENNLLSFLSQRSLDEMFTSLTEDYVGTPVLATADRSRLLIGGLRGDTAMIVLDDEGRRVSLLGMPVDSACFMPGVFSEKWALSPDGRTAVCLSLLGVIAGWDTDTGELLYLKGFDQVNGGFDSSEISFSADSERMAYAAEDQLYVAMVRTDEVVLQAAIDATSIVPALAFTEDGRYLLMTNQSLFIINAETWALELVENADFGSQYNNVIPLRDSFLITRYDGTANFYSMPEMCSVQTLDDFAGELCEAQSAVFPSVPLESEHRYTDVFLQTTGQYLDTTARLAFSRDGKTAALSYADGVIELFDTEGDGRVSAMIGELSGAVDALAMTEGQLVASDQSTRLLFYDLSTRSVQRILNVGVVYASFAFDPAGKVVMALCGGRTRIDVYSLETFEKLFSLHATADTFTDMAFSQDGRFAVGATAAGRFVVGDLWTDEDALLARARRLVGADE